MAGFKLKKGVLERDKPESPRMRLCVDFGTAACKAVASLGTSEKLFLIPLGQASGDATQRFSVSSSLFLANNRLYFGHEAIRVSLRQKAFTTRRIESLKTWLGRGEMSDPDGVQLEADQNPDGGDFSRGDALTMLLAFVLDHATTALHKQAGVRYIKRRFTRPVWDQARATWYDGLMARYITRGQLVADTLSGEWSGGLPMSVVREVLDQARAIDPCPWLVDPRGALEPVAAGFSRMEREYEHRTLAVVVDIGAGTTDMASLVAIQPDGEGQVRRAKPQGKPTSELNAGDTLDEILRNHILEGIDIPGGQEDELSVQLDQNCRLWKEELFISGSVQPTFAGGVVGKEIRRENFLRLGAVRTFESKIRDQFDSQLESVASLAETLASSGFHPLTSIRIIPAGGGARLPVVSSLGGQRKLRGVNFLLSPTDLEPRWFAKMYGGGDPNLFPKLAVATGGASPWLPDAN